MANIELFSGPDCIKCKKAKALLERHGLAFTEYDIERPADMAEIMRRLPQARSIPQIFVDGEHIGDHSDLERLIESGALSGG